MAGSLNLRRQESGAKTRNLMRRGQGLQKGATLEPARRKRSRGTWGAQRERPNGAHRGADRGKRKQISKEKRGVLREMPDRAHRGADSWRRRMKTWEMVKK